MERAISDFVCTPTTYLLCKKIFAGEEYIIPPFLDPKVIVDIGANVGAMTVHLRGKYPDATIYAIEPSRESFSLLRFNTRNDPNCVLLNVAISDHSGEAMLRLGSDGRATDSLYENHFSSASSERVRVRNISTFLLDEAIKNISILKIDTEGSEIPIISSIKWTFLHHVDVILLEYHDESDRRQLDELLSTTHVLYAARADKPHRGVLTYILDRLAEENDCHRMRISR